jgi:hypothetical protein
LALLGVLVLRWAGLSWAVIAICLLSPAALWNFQMGQWEFFCGSVLVAGLLLQGRAQACGGALLSLMILKPQIAFPVPLGLLAAERWRTILGGAVAVALILGLTTACFGISVWSAWLHFGVGTARQNLIQGHSVRLEESISVFWMMRNLGAGLRRRRWRCGWRGAKTKWMRWNVWH